MKLIYAVAVTLITFKAFAQHDSDSALSTFTRADFLMQKTAKTANIKIDGFISELQEYGKIDSGQKYHVAMRVDSIIDNFVSYVESLKQKVIAGAGGDKFRNDDIINSSKLFIKKGEGRKLKLKINETREELLAQLDEKDRVKVKSDLIANDNTVSSLTWERELFEHSPAAAVLTLLQKFKNDALNTELQILNILNKQAKGEEDKKYYKAVVSSDRFNTLYVGIDNPVSIAIPGVLPEKITVAFSGALASKTAPTNFILKISQKGKVMISVSFIDDEGERRSAGNYTFIADSIPSPIISLGIINHGAKATLKEIIDTNNRLITKLSVVSCLEGVKFTVTSFTVSIHKLKGENPEPVECAGNVLSDKVRESIGSLVPGDKIIIDKIMVSGPNGVKEAPPIVITIL